MTISMIIVCLSRKSRDFTEPSFQTVKEKVTIVVCCQIICIGVGYTQNDEGSFSAQFWVNALLLPTPYHVNY